MPEMKWSFERLDEETVQVIDPSMPYPVIVNRDSPDLRVRALYNLVTDLLQAHETGIRVTLGPHENL